METQGLVRDTAQSDLSVEPVVSYVLHGERIGNKDVVPAVSIVAKALKFCPFFLCKMSVSRIISVL